ncbi:MAG: DNA repair protein RecN [Pseudomonadota bacterium]
MLRTLDIRDILIIDRLELDFQPGLNVLTGETGAGKSILLDALGFVLGWRGRAELVRQGAAQGEVVAIFDLPSGHPGRAVLEDAGLPFEDELILRRVNNRDGRKTAWINDRRVSGDVLRALSDTLVELHGQQDDRGLLDPRGHRAMLDAFGRCDALRDVVSKAWTAQRSAHQARADAQAAQSVLREEEDFLRHAVAELIALDPQPGEEAQLDARRRVMQGAERMRLDVARALTGLGVDGAEGAAGEAMRWLQGIQGEAEGALDAALAAIERALVELGEAQNGVSDFARMLDFDSSELEQIEERLFEIRGLARKHQVLPDDLTTFSDTLRGRLAAIDAGSDEMAALDTAVADAEAAYRAAAVNLTAARRAAAAKLDAAMALELPPLKLDRAVFTTQLAAAEPGPTGCDAVTFEVATNPGAPAGALNKIASGGELSRFLLALKVCLTGEGTGQTMIFDEIDRGVGGATADAVGRRLKSLADGGQVLVVTHSPQVAARGGHHWQVVKQSDQTETLSRVQALSADERIDELARMLSGDRITDAARDAARALLSDG